MAISIVSGQITTIRKPAASAPVIRGGLASFNAAQASSMHAEGIVRFDGSAADLRDGWDIGWVQAQWIETNWGYYRGQVDHDGSVFVQRGKPPARQRQGCRDTSGPVGDIFTDPNDPREFQHLPAGPFPLAVRVESNDPPGENYDTFLDNKLTHKRNFLHTVQLEFHFCTILTVRDPAGIFHHQAHFYWNIHWQYQFVPTAFPNPTDAQWTATPVKGGNATNAGHAISGAPADHRFVGVLTSCATIQLRRSGRPSDCRR